MTCQEEDQQGESVQNANVLLDWSCCPCRRRGFMTGLMCYLFLSSGKTPLHTMDQVGSWPTSSIFGHLQKPS